MISPFFSFKTKIPRGCTPLLLNVFSDGTAVQKFGHLSFHPIFATIGNLDSDLRRKDIGYRLVGFIPVLEGTEQERRKESFRFAKMLLFQQCLDLFLSSFLKHSFE